MAEMVSAKTLELLTLKKVMCCDKVYEDREQYDIEGQYTEDTSTTYLIAFARVHRFIEGIAGHAPAHMRTIQGPIDKSFSHLIRVMQYNAANRATDTRWFGTRMKKGLTEELGREFVEVTSELVPKMNVAGGIVGRLDGVNMRCEEHWDSWYRITYFEFLNGPPTEVAAAAVAQTSTNTLLRPLTIAGPSNSKPTSSPKATPTSGPNTYLPPPVIPNNSQPPLTPAEAALIPAPSTILHPNLSPSAKQIPWAEQEGATWIYGKLCFQCAKETISEKSKKPRRRIVWKGWNCFSIRQDTGIRFKVCTACREKEKK